MPRPPSNVTQLVTATELKKKGPGRPPNLEMPPIADEILSAMSELEREHFDFFVAAYEQAYEQKYGKKPTPTARINIVQAALDYIHLFRLQAEQMKTGSLVSQARQHPGVQVRAWLQSAGLQERDIEVQKPQQEDTRSATAAALLKLSGD